ncbi:MAG: BrnA antitoxin family protein [bacterium]|nr:BrnA antitoxin family protein [bacterium]
MKAKINKIPKFKNEDEERKFWEKHSFLDFPDSFKEVKLDFSKLKPSTKPVTIRLPLSLVEDLKIIANKRDVPYQSLMKILLAEKISEEFSSV